MLNKNFANMIVGAFNNGSNMQCAFVDVNGTSFTSVSDNTCNPTVFFKNLFNISTVKRTDLAHGSYHSTFSLGSGDTAESINDYMLESPIDETNFTIVSAATTKPTQRDKVIPTQLWRYDGTDEIVIKEVGWFTKLWTTNTPTVMFDRTVLESPITVNNGDVFSIALSVGGKATVTVNS